MTATATSKLICPECRHENEVERVYCHSCGAKLDRSAVKEQKEPVQDTRQRVKKMFDPTRAKIRYLFFKTSKYILGAAALAVVILMILPPDVPEPKKELVLASQVRIDMENALQHHSPPQLNFTEDQVNAYLASALKTKQSALNKPMLDFNRAVAAFREAQFTLIVERSVFGFSLFSAGSFGVTLNEGKIVTSNQGGAIGRMPIHPLLMQYADVIFADIWVALDRDAKLVSKFAGIEFHDKSAALIVTPQ
jgi:hypothetical protein